MMKKFISNSTRIQDTVAKVLQVSNSESAMSMHTHIHTKIMCVIYAI